MLSCLSLLCMCGLGLYPFSGLVYDLLLRSRRGLSPKAHSQKSISFHTHDGHCLMESGGSFLYASCGGGFLQPMTV